MGLSEKPEDIYVDFVRNYEGYWIGKYKTLIKKIVKDLRELKKGIEGHDTLVEPDIIYTLIDKYEAMIE